MTERQRALEQEAARRFIERLEGQGNTHELQQWLAADPRHAEQFQRLEQSWGASATLPSVRRNHARLQRRKWRLPMMALLTITMLPLLWLLLPQHPLADYRTDIGEIGQFQLADGSVLELSSNSAVDVSFTANRRRLRLLHGQAWFQVQPASNRPFEVDTDHGRVTALGTAFDLQQQDDAAILTVTEHSVRVDSGEHSRRVDAGQRLRFNAETSQYLSADPLHWRQRRLLFVSRPLEDVVTALDQWQHGRTIIIGRELAQRPVTLMASTEHPRLTLQALANDLPARVIKISPWLTVLVAAPADSNTPP